MTDITPKQQEILNFVATELTTGVSPTFREIAEVMRIASTNGVADHINALVKKGYLDRKPGGLRSLRLTEKGRAAARYDGVRVLGAVSGLGPAAVSQALAEVQANTARLASCVTPHVFRRPDDAKPGDRYTCTHCAGTIRGPELHWYELGLAHGGRR